MFRLNKDAGSDSDSSTSSEPPRKRKRYNRVLYPDYKEYEVCERTRKNNTLVIEIEDHSEYIFLTYNYTRLKYINRLYDRFFLW